MKTLKMIVNAMEYYGNYRAVKDGYSVEEISTTIHKIISLYESAQKESDTNQLTVRDIVKSLIELSETMETSELLDLPIYIGDDDELNGIHNAWYRQMIDADNEEDADLVELINENSTNIELKGKALLIS